MTKAVRSAQHGEVEEIGALKCPHCNKTLSMLVRTTKHRGTWDALSCEECNLKFDIREYLYVMLQDIHGRQYPVVRQSINLNKRQFYLRYNIEPGDEFERE